MGSGLLLSQELVHRTAGSPFEDNILWEALLLMPFLNLSRKGFTCSEEDHDLSGHRLMERRPRLAQDLYVDVLAMPPPESNQLMSLPIIIGRR
jgi:hypothetical protein